MMRITRLVGTQVAGALLAGTASAAVMATPPLDAAKWDEYACNVVNIGNQPVNVTAELVDIDDGTVLARGELSVPAGAGARVTQLEDDFGFGAFCRFVVPAGRRDVRASITVYGNADGRDVAHAEAR
jgi:hypothetical protein